MPANIPSPIVGAGGGGQPWFEQLLLTLASQGPGVLMQWLENRQAGQQAQAIDAADQAALQSFAGTANPMEQGAIRAAGGSPGIAAAGGGAMPGGGTAPIVKPMTAGNQPNMQGMRQGVAGPLLDRLSQLRTNQGQQDASAAATEASKATTADTIQTTNQNRILFPARQEQIAAATRASDASTRASNVAADADVYTRDFNKSTEKYRKDLMLAQLLHTQNMASEAEAVNRKAQLELRTFAADHASADMQRIADQVKALAGTFPELMTQNPKAIQGMAANMILGTPAMPSRADLVNYYQNMANSDTPVDLNKMMEDRVMQQYGVTPEDLSAMDAAFNASGDNPEEALETLSKRGASVEQLAQATGYYMAKTGRPVGTPAAKKDAIASFFGSMFLSSGNTGPGGKLQDIGSSLLNVATFGGAGALVRKSEAVEAKK